MGGAAVPVIIIFSTHIQHTNKSVCQSVSQCKCVCADSDKPGGSAGWLGSCGAPCLSEKTRHTPRPEEVVAQHIGSPPHDVQDLHASSVSGNKQAGAVGGWVGSAARREAESQDDSSGQTSSVHRNLTRLNLACVLSRRALRIVVSPFDSLGCNITAAPPLGSTQPYCDPRPAGWRRNKFNIARQKQNSQ
jgi:hypothetical protein